MSLTTFSYLIIVLCMVLFSMRFNVHWYDNMDFVRHSRQIDFVRSLNISLFDFLFNNKYTLSSNDTLDYCYGFKFAIYIVAKWFQNDYVLVWASIFLDYGIIAYIGIDWWTDNGRRSILEAVFEILLCYSMLPYIHACSGLRTATAASIAALAIYNYLYKNKSVLNFVILFFIAFSFHSFVLIVIPFLICAKRFSRKTALLFSAVMSVGVSVVVKLCSVIPIPLLNSLAHKYMQYSGENGYRGSRFYYYGMLIACSLIICQFIILTAYKKEARPQKNKIGNWIQSMIEEKDPAHIIYTFIACYMIFVVSNIGASEMVARPCYVLGAMAPVTSKLLFLRNPKIPGSQPCSVVLNGMIFTIIVYVSFMYLTYYAVWFQ